MEGQEWASLPARKAAYYRKRVLSDSESTLFVDSLNRLLSQPTFWQGQKDSFSSLDARRSGRLYRAKGHGIHCRPILVLLQEANKKIGCFRNRPFGRAIHSISEHFEMLIFEKERLFFVML